MRFRRRRLDRRNTIGVSVNKFSSRILPSRKHSPVESLVVMVFFLLILGCLLWAGYKAQVGAVVYLYLLGASVVGLGVIIELYFIVSNWLVTARHRD